MGFARYGVIFRLLLTQACGHSLQTAPLWCVQGGTAKPVPQYCKNSRVWEGSICRCVQCLAMSYSAEPCAWSSIQCLAMRTAFGVDSRKHFLFIHVRMELGCAGPCAPPWATSCVQCIAIVGV